MGSFEPRDGAPGQRVPYSRYKVVINDRCRVDRFPLQ